jgi:hypothetical protein
LEYAILKLKEEKSKLIRNQTIRCMMSSKNTFEYEREKIRIQKEIDEITEAIIHLKVKGIKNKNN